MLDEVFSSEVSSKWLAVLLDMIWGAVATSVDRERGLAVLFICSDAQLNKRKNEIDIMILFIVGDSFYLQWPCLIEKQPWHIKDCDCSG